MKTKVFGDFQTPLPLARQIISYLQQSGVTWSRILEPTCGTGTFIQALLEMDSRDSEIIGIEIQENYAKEAQRLTSHGSQVKIMTTNIFDIDVGTDLEWRTNGQLLVVGNPPWVTNSAMGTLGGDNLPHKSNFKRFRGIDAITGHANFDIAEFIWLKLITELAETPATISLLCKTSVARNVLRFAHEAKLPVANASIHRIEAKKWFNTFVDACLFTVSLHKQIHTYQAPVYRSIEATEQERVIGYVRSAFVADVAKYEQHASLDLNEREIYIWRSGIKHDASPIMELTQKNGRWVNGFARIVEVEDGYVFPLVESSDILTLSEDKITRRVIVPQKRINEDTTQLPLSAPKLWMYLSFYSEAFKARKSSIYKGKPPFSVFGVGDYSFADYKVIVSGFYKTPLFVPIGLIATKPVICDDTCYFLPVNHPLEATIIAAALNHKIARQFIESIVFWDAKRPITKSILSRIDIASLIQLIPPHELESVASVYLDIYPGLKIDNASKAGISTLLKDLSWLEV